MSTQSPSAGGLALLLGASLGLMHAMPAQAQTASECPRANVRISEVVFAPAAGETQWVELSNAGLTAVDVRGMELVSGTNAFSLPTDLEDMPTNGFILIRFDGQPAGSNDVSFAGDNLAVLHASPTNFLGNPNGYLGLYQVTGRRTESTLVDFVAWGNAPGDAAVMAVKKGLWSSDQVYVPTSEENALDGPSFTFVSPGGSLARRVGGGWFVVAPGGTTPGQANVPVLAAPLLEWPNDGLQASSTPAKFWWKKVEAAASYQFQIATDAAFANLVVAVTTDDYHLRLEAPLADNTRYFWRVRAVGADTNEVSAWSDTWQFTIGFPPASGAPAPKSRRSKAAVPDSIRGKVTDIHNAAVALPGVQVWAGGRTNLTDASGDYVLGGLSAGTYTLQASFPNYTFTPVNVNVPSNGVVVVNLQGTPSSNSIPVVPLGARKDTTMLAITPGATSRVMCDRSNANQQGWDVAHNQANIQNLHLESWWCWAVGITMVNNYYGGTIRRDEVVYRVRGDLLHDRDAGSFWAQYLPGLFWAFNNANATNFTVLAPGSARPNAATVRGWIDANRPIYYRRPGHIMVVRGYRYVGTNFQCEFVNVDNDGGTRWWTWNTVAFGGCAVPQPTLIGNARNTDNRLASDGDSDGVNDWDETVRTNATGRVFHSASNKSDTDADTLPDKIEIISWVFPKDTGQGGNVSGRPFNNRNVDGDNKNPENDEDSDDGGLKDGKEDLNKDGLKTGTETDVYDARDDVALDLVFCIDLTGSMGDDIAQVKVNAVNIVNTVATNFLDFRIALVGYKDHPIEPYGDPGDYPFRDFLAFTTNKTAVINAINGLSVGGGNDWPEAVYSGLIHSMDGASLGGWRPDPTKRAIILMGDAPPHDPEPVTGYTIGTVAARAASGGFIISGGGAGGGGRAKGVGGTSGPISVFSLLIGNDSSARSAFSEISKVSGGSLVEAAGASEVPAQILTLLEEIKLSTAAVLDVSGPSGETEPRGLTNIVANASRSVDPEGCGILQYEWDWDGDGTYDETTLEPIVSHEYPDGFTGPLGLRITTVGGGTASTILTLPAAGGVEIVSQTLATTIDPQTGLFHQTVVVTNSGTADITGLRLSANNLGAGVSLIGATGTNGTVPFIDVPVALAAGDSLTLTLSYYAADRQAPTGVDVAVETVTPATPPTRTGTTLAIRRAFIRPDGYMAVEFDSEPGRRYVIEYSSDLETWKQVATPLQAFGTRFLWVDVGPPATESPPVEGQRFYRVIVLSED